MLLWLIWAVSPASAEAWLTLNLSLASANVLLGDPVFATVVEANEGETACTILTSPYPAGTHIVVKGPAGRPLFYQGRQIEAPFGVTTLLAGESRKRVYPLSELYAFNAPGTYVLQAYNGMSDTDPKAVRSNEVRLEVVEDELVYAEKLSRTIGKDTYTHEVRVSQSSHGVVVAYRVTPPAGEASQEQVLMGSLYPGSRPVLALDRDGECHILIQTGDLSFKYWAFVYRDNSLLRVNSGQYITDAKAPCTFPPVFQLTANGGVYLQPREK